MPFIAEKKIEYEQDHRSRLPPVLRTMSLQYFHFPACQSGMIHSLSKSGGNLGGDVSASGADRLNRSD